MFKWLKRRDEAPALHEPEPSLRDALLSERPSDILFRWAKSGYLFEVLPDLDALRGVTQLPAHRDDAFIHTLKVVDAIEPTPVRRWAALLHDIGKGPTFIETPEGRSRFFDHDRVGAVMVGEIMPASGESAELTERVSRLVSLHMRPISYNSEWTDAAVRRLRDDAEESRGSSGEEGDGWRDLLALARADLRGYLPEPIDRGLWVLDSLEEHCRRLDEEDGRAALAQARAPQSPLDGSELIELAKQEGTHEVAGPWVGALKEYLLEQVTEGTLQREDKGAAVESARTWLTSHADIPRT